MGHSTIYTGETTARRPRAGTKPRTDQGLTLIEVLATATLIALLLTGVLSAFVWSEKTMREADSVTQLQMVAQRALDRLVEVASLAVTGDEQFTPIRTGSGLGSHGLRFRLIASVDPVTGDPVYDDAARVYIYGPDSGSEPSRGLVIGRGPTLNAIHAAAAGPDGFLGTADDDADVVLAGGVPAVELLIRDTYSPQTGDMFTMNVTPAPVGRRLTFTIRINFRSLEGNFVFPNDMVLTESVALRQ